MITSYLMYLVGIKMMENQFFPELEKAANLDIDR